MLEIVHMIDTGGQPEMMGVMPSFIYNANLAVLVMHDLNGCPAISFHEEGVAYNRKLSSQYTGREIVLKIAFVLNLKKPEKCDKNVLDLIRTNVTECNLGEVFEVPGSFFMFEQDLIKVCSRGWL